MYTCAKKSSALISFAECLPLPLLLEFELFKLLPVQPWELYYLGTKESG